MERAVTYTHDPAILIHPIVGVWRLACMVQSRDAGIWVCHWERVP